MNRKMILASLEEQEAPTVFALKEDDSLDKEEDDRKDDDRWRWSPRNHLSLESYAT